MFDTIAAISSGKINQPISIIKISGTDAFKIVKKIFKPFKKTQSNIKYGFILDGKTKVDEVLTLWFKKPNSFTGEDIVEIHAHGGVVNTNKILKMLLVSGARMAKNGEFSLRAFLNGKLDLLKAEAIHDLIFAKTEEQALMSVSKFDGITTKLIDDLLQKVEKLISIMSINIDYPEYDDVEKLTNQTLLPKLEKIKNILVKIQESSKMSKYIYQGVKAAIVGIPNSGKSSLLNFLINQNKAIVSNIPGTTRDVVEGQVQIGQIIFNFKDTAGLREKSRGEIEQIGIKKTFEAVKKADLVIHIVPINKKLSSMDLQVKKVAKTKPYIFLWSKCDLAKSQKKKNCISVKEKNITALIDKIQTSFKHIDLNNNYMLNNTRQIGLIDSALKNINEAIKNLKKKHSIDTVIIDIEQCWEDLANILGKGKKADLINKMFKNFCLGK